MPPTTPAVTSARDRTARVLSIAAIAMAATRATPSYPTEARIGTETSTIIEQAIRTDSTSPRMFRMRDVRAALIGPSSSAR